MPTRAYPATDMPLSLVGVRQLVLGDDRAEVPPQGVSAPKM